MGGGEVKLGIWAWCWGWGWGWGSACILEGDEVRDGSAAVEVDRQCFGRDLQVGAANHGHHRHMHLRLGVGSEFEAPRLCSFEAIVKGKAGEDWLSERLACERVPRVVYLFRGTGDAQGSSDLG